MAGRKITQLPVLTTPAATDKLVIVDVSDTSESPQGTSKQIAVGDLGLSSIESSTLDVSIADGVATVDSIFSRSVFQFTIEETTATLVAQINNLGGVISLTNEAAFVFSFTRTGGDLLTGQVIGMIVPGLQEVEGGLPIVYIASAAIEVGTAISFKFPDGTSIPNTSSINATFIIDYYPNGWDS
jgi:hypothetical protein